jgi:ribosomal protein S12 methylthiotransferase accessory factor
MQNKIDVLEKISAFERSVPVNEAIKKLEKVKSLIIHNQNVVFNHYRRGKTDIVYVEDVNGIELSYGLGKGVHSLLGAYGECIEHLFYDRIGLTSNSKIPLAQFIKSKQYKADYILKHSLSLKGAPEELECIEFRYYETDESFFIPKIYVNYNFLDHKGKPSNDCLAFLSRYVTTSGTAFGFTQNDAYLHALNEIIERDLTSEFMLLLLNPKYEAKSRFSKLDISTLPIFFLDLILDLKKVSWAQKIEIYISKTIFNTWWSICIVRFKNSSIFILPQWGAGSSLLFDLALYRSITECRQMVENYSNENLKSDKRLVHFVRVYKKLINISYFKNTNQFRIVKYQKEYNISKTSVENQVSIICDSMKKRGFMPSVHVVISTPQFSIVCAYAPNLERFYNITKSVPTLPINFIKSETLKSPHVKNG